MTICRQMSQYACFHLEKLFCMLTLFQSRIRPKRENGNQSTSAAMHLGTLYSCLQNLHLDCENWRHADITIDELYPGLMSALKYIKWIGYGLAQENFERGCIKEPLPSSSFRICVFPLPQPKSRLSDGPTGDDHTFVEAIHSLSRRRKMKTLHLEDFGVQLTLPKRVSGKANNGSNKHDDIDDALFASECLRQQLENWQKTAAADAVSLRSTHSVQAKVYFEEDRFTAARSPSFSSSGTTMIDGFPPRMRIADDDLYHEFVRSEAYTSGCTTNYPPINEPSMEPPQFVMMQDVERSKPAKASSVSKIFKIPGTKRKASITSPSQKQKPSARKNIPIAASVRGASDTARQDRRAVDVRIRAEADIQGPKLNAYCSPGPHLTDIVPELPYDPLFQAGQTTDRPSSYPQSRKWRKSVGRAVKAIRDGLGDLELDAHQQQHVIDKLAEHGLKP